jgi:hypothetical protein
VTGRQNVVTFLELQQVVTAKLSSRATCGTCWSTREVLYGQASVTTLIQSLATSKHSNHDADILWLVNNWFPKEGGIALLEILVIASVSLSLIFIEIHIRRC